MLALFYSLESVAPETLRDALSPLTLEQVLSTGFCSFEDHQVVANVFIQPYGNLLFAVGISSRLPGPDGDVMQISNSSLELAHLMNPQHVRDALDLGTGCGFLATQLSPRADRVYALDLNSRAVQFAEINARWNSLSNISCLQGNLFEPVRGLRLDLIVCNPPFYICPVTDSTARQALFKHSGMEGDSFCLNLAREAPRFLNENGFFHMMFSWMQREKQNWHLRLESAFSGLGCDVWCLRTEEQSSEDYVSFWCENLPDVEDVDFAALRQQGMEYFQRLKVTSIGTGLLTLRRCTSRSNHLWFDDAPDDRSEPYGAASAALFGVRAKFDSAPDELILQQNFVPAQDIACIQKSVRKNDRWDAIAVELCRDSGLKYTLSGVDPLLSEIVTRLDGHTSLREILEGLSRERHLPLTQLLATHLPSIRELLRYGFVLPAPDL